MLRAVSACTNVARRVPSRRGEVNPVLGPLWPLKVKTCEDFEEPPLRHVTCDVELR